MDTSPTVETDPEDEDEGLRDDITEITALLVLGAGLLALFLGFKFFWLIFVVGFAVLVPLSGKIYDLVERAVEDERTRSSDTSEDDPLATLRERYARGEIDEVEFERRLEQLLETESSADARSYADRIERERERQRERGHDGDREGQRPEYEIE